MAEIFPNTDEVGSVLIQVQDDLKKLRRSLSRITLHEKGEGFNVKALDTAIHRTEIGIRRRAEDYLKTVNKRVLTLPSIEDFEKKKVQISKWKPALESIPDMHPPRGQGVMVSAGEKHKAALTTRLLCNPVHPKNRAVMHQSYGIQLPDLPKRSTASVSTHKIVTGPTVGSLAVVPGGPRCHVYLAPPLSEDDVRAGMAGLVEKGFPLSAAELCLVQTSVHPKAAPLHHRDQSSKTATPERSKCLKALTSGKEMTKAEHEGLPTWNHTPPPSAASKTSNPRHTSQGAAQLTSLNPQCRPSPAPQLVGKLSFAITEGRIDPAAPDFRCFKQHYCLSWSTVVEAVWSLERLLRDFAVPQAQVNGSRLAELARGTGPGWGWGGRGGGCSVELLLSVLENREEVWDLVSRPGQRYKGEGGAEAAAVCIQTCWRRHVARAAYLLYHKRKWAAGTIAISWLMHAQLGRVRKALQATRHRHLENFRTRAQHLAANWKLIQSSWRTIIHIPSLGYPHPHRFSLKGFDILQNIQMGRLCDVRDEKVQVIYVSPVNLGEDVRLYYSRLLKLQGGGEGGERFTIITPDALDYFPTHNMCLSTLLKYSPRTLRRIRNLIQGKPAYIVGGVAHVDDLAVADELGVAILGPEPAVAQLYGTKSGGRRVFTSAEVNIAPGQWDIYSLQQLHDSLARLMADNTDVQRWLFKIDAELEGRGTAFCDVSHLSCHAWAQREFQRHRPQRWRSAWAQEVVLIRYLEEVPVWLARHARPVRTSCYPDWAAFLEAFLRQGGVVEAYPPSDSVTCLTVDLLLEPGGDVTMLSCGDQLHGPSMLETAGSSVPQSSVCPDVLHAFCSSVGRACLQRHIVGYVSLDLATFLDPRTLEQKVWAVDLDLTYSNQLAMTQVLLCITGGTLNCRTSCLEVSAPVKKSSSHQKGATQNTTPSLSRRYAVIGSRLLHTNLSMVHYSVFFQMCKAYGIGFDVKEKQGTAFALHDSNERYSLGMITISEDLQGALLTFARNLSVIHQEISAPNMQGETNFKDLIKDVEDVLGVTVQNKSSATQEEDTAVVQS